MSQALIGNRQKRLTRVAAQVQAETTPAAISPGLTVLDALVNSSEFFGEYEVYRVCKTVSNIINRLKNIPIPDAPIQMWAFFARERFQRTYRSLKLRISRQDLSRDWTLTDNVPTP